MHDHFPAGEDPAEYDVIVLGGGAPGECVLYRRLHCHLAGAVPLPRGVEAGGPHAVHVAVDEAEHVGREPLLHVQGREAHLPDRGVVEHHTTEELPVVRHVHRAAPTELPVAVAVHAITVGDPSRSIAPRSRR